MNNLYEANKLVAEEFPMASTFAKKVAARVIAMDAEEGNITLNANLMAAAEVLKGAMNIPLAAHMMKAWAYGCSYSQDGGYFYNLMKSAVDSYMRGEAFQHLRKAA